MERISYMLIEIFLRDTQLPVPDVCPHLRMNFSAAPGDFREAGTSVRHPFSIISMVRTLVEFPAVIFTETLQIFPSRHMISPLSVSLSVNRHFITKGICSCRTGSDVQNSKES